MSKPIKKSSKVHPSSPPGHDHRSHLALLLPAAILSLTAALSPEDTEVLAYLISFHSNSSSVGKSASATSTDDDGDVSVHPPVFGCNCFRCYTSFWSRWDASPNRDLIHEIIEAYEEGLSRKKSTKAKKRRKSNNKVGDHDHSSTEPADGKGNGGGASESGCRDSEVGSPEKGSSIRKAIGFIGEKIWGAWTRV
ncbi:hypothetical protein CRG98_015374 [Punica granatum]|uniref:Uncharacterized protein n=1 Tax=Punica granatum TaxID=22663 RepID=A0A2I0K6L9_PUNGR|nr:hypothetical protein CRG98_015374 [Punica granatum]